MIANQANWPINTNNFLIVQFRSTPDYLEKWYYSELSEEYLIISYQETQGRNLFSPISFYLRTSGSPLEFI